MLRIESTKNPRIQDWKRLHTSKGRAEAGLFLLEGRHLVEEAAHNGVEIDELLLREGEQIGADIRGAARTVVEVTTPVMNAACEASSPQGVAAVCKFPWARAWRDLASRARKVLILDGVQDPGNVGTLIRTADAAGLDTIVLGPGTADAYSTKTLRASQGSLFHVRVAEATVEEAIEDLRAAGTTVFGSALGRDALNYRMIAAQESFALVVGNEGSGIRRETRDACDAVVMIPMPGRAESLSVAVAAGIILFHLVGR